MSPPIINDLTPPKQEALPIKPGYQTTEFWAHVGVTGISLLVILGVVNGKDAASLGDQWAQSVTAIFMVIGNIVSSIHYVKSRTAIKLASKDV